MEKSKGSKKRLDPCMRLPPKPELEEFFESVHERMKNLAIARKPYKGRNDKELTIKPGEIFEVLDDVGSWWCLRAPSGRTGHVPKYNLDVIPNPIKDSFDRYHELPPDPIIVKVPVIVKTSVQREETVEEPIKPISNAPPKRQPLTPPSEQPVDSPQSVALQMGCAPQMETCPSSMPPFQQQTFQPSPQAIFPTPRSMPHSHHQQHGKWPCHTVVKEIIREISPPMRYHRCRPKRPHERPSASPVSCGSATSSSSEAASSSSGAASSVSGRENYDKMLPRAPRVSAKKENKTRKQQICPQPQPPHPGPIRCCHSGLRRSSVSGCRHGSMCCGASQPTTISTSEVSRRYSRRASPSMQNHQQTQQPQQPMIILLEAAKQESQQPQPTYDEQPMDDNFDAQPQISIMMPPGAQFTPPMAVGGAPMPTSTQAQYGNATAPGFYNWPYYQGYA